MRPMSCPAREAAGRDSPGTRPGQATAQPSETGVDLTGRVDVTRTNSPNRNPD